MQVEDNGGEKYLPNCINSPRWADKVSLAEQKRLASQVAM